MKNVTLFQLRGWLAGLIGFGLALVVHAQTPSLINCQGRLFDGEKLLDGEVTMTLRIFNQPEGGALLYEDVNRVQVVDGIYSTFLGDNTTKGDLNNALSRGTAYLEVTADGTTFMPREALSSVPFAKVAEGVKTAGVTADMIKPSSISAEQLAQGAVGTDHLADGAVTPPKLSEAYWSTSGNVSQGGKITFMGTLDGRPLDMRVGNKRALRLEPAKTSPNVIGGHEVNRSGDGVNGATVSGGGAPGAINSAASDYATVGGGIGNRAGKERSTISGGRSNNADGIASVIGGGYSNQVSQSYGTVGGGYGNKNDGYVGTVSGGWNNQASGKVASIGGGQDNGAKGPAATVSGGWKNHAEGNASTVSGGHSNTSAGNFAVVGGGTNNFASGHFAVVPGGGGNVASGDYSLAGGKGAKASHSGSFVWSDSEGGIATTGDNQFLVQAAGNVGIDTNAPSEKLTVAGNVKAAAFIGDGSKLSGVLGSDMPFGGDVTGTAKDLLIRPGTIMPKHLAPGLIDDAVKRSELANQVSQLSRHSVSRNTVVQGEVIGTIDDLKLKKGSITADKLAPDLKKQVMSGSSKGAITRATVFDGDIVGSATNLHLRAGSVTAEKLSPEIRAGLQELEEGMLSKGISFGGDVEGAAGALRIKKGAVTADKLAPNVIEQAVSQSMVAGQMAKMRREVLTRDFVAGGEVAGTLDGLQIRKGAVTPDKLSPQLSGMLKELSEGSKPGDFKFGGDVVGSSDKLRIKPGVITADKLAPGVVDAALQSSKVGKELMSQAKAMGNAGQQTRQIMGSIEALKQDAMSSNTRFEGDVSGTAGELRIQRNAVKSEHVAPGSITREKLNLVGTLEPGRNAQDALGSSKNRWKSVFVENRIDYNETLTFTSGGVVKMVVDGAGNLSVEGLRLSRHPESPSLIGGHNANRVVQGAVGATIAGGGNADHPNVISSEYGAIAGGFGNRVNGFNSSVGGGQDNLAGGKASAIAGGFMNQADGLFPAVGGGAANVATSNASVISGGFSNKVEGAYATIPGGYQNFATGDFSLAAGYRAMAAHKGAFVWADSSPGDFGSTAADQFSVRAAGGTVFYSNASGTAGVKVPAGGGAWSMLSDRNAKENIEAIDADAVLDAVADLPVYQWNYRSQDDGVRHMGPTAQDFYAAFGLGDEDTHISAIDADGVALSAIKGLVQRLRAKDAELAALREENESLKVRFEDVEQKVNTFFEILENLPEEE